MQNNVIAKVNRSEVFQQDVAVEGLLIADNFAPAIVSGSQPSVSATSNAFIAVYDELGAIIGYLRVYPHS